MLKKYNSFILEWGTDANKDPIKVGDRIMTEIDLRDDQEDQDEKGDIEGQLEIMFGGADMSESADPNIDPYGEEDWVETTYNYIQWKKEKKSLYKFLKQFNNSFIDECLKYICLRKKREIENVPIFDEILYELNPENEDASLALDQENYDAVKRDMGDLLELCEPDEEDEEIGPDPDEWYEYQREKEYERGDR